jgi:DNA-binding transcriptional regulator LsrR (DeoR family)
MNSSQANERIRLIACALLRSQGFSQSDIAERIGMSQPEVSRMLQAAITKNLLRPHPSFLRENVTAEEFERAEALYGGTFSALEKEARALVPRGVTFRLHVVSATDLPAFCEQAARHVTDLLADGSLTVGTMWGSTSERIINGVTRMARPSKGSEIRAIPLAGDPLYLLNQENQEYSASVLAARLERAFTGRTRSDLPSLNGVPAYISKTLMADKKKAVVLHDFIRNIPGYKRIFGEDGYVDALDTVLTGVGVFATNPLYSATFLREREAQEGPDFEEVRPLILGDFAGSILPQPGLRAKEIELVAGLNQGWMGISLEQLKKVASGGKVKSPPGVITVGFGPDKAGILAESMKRGLVNHLVVDEQLARRLVDRD